jgi:uncharacterized membrane protein
MASTLIAIAFEGEYTARGLLDNLEKLQKEGVVKLDDAVVASRPGTADVMFTQLQEARPTGVSAGTPQAHIEQTDSRRGRFAAAGAGVGLIIGTILGGPIGGLAVGGIVGALRDRGIDDKFAKQVAEGLGPDSSALLLLGSATDPDRVLAEFAPYKGRVLHTTLAPETEKRLRDALTHEQ